MGKLIKAFKDIRYILISIHKYDRKLLIYCTLFSTMKGLSPFVFIILPQLLVEELMNARRADYILTVIFIGCFIYTILTIFKNYFNAKCIPGYARIRNAFTIRHWDKTLTMDYEHLEDKDMLDQNRRALRAVSSTSLGFEAAIKKMFELFSYGLSLIGYIAIISRLHFLVVILIALVVIINFYIDLSTKRYDQKLNISNITLQRKADYLSNLMHDFTYAKDIRLYRMNDWIYKDFDHTYEANIDVQRRIQRRNLISGIAIQCGVISQMAASYGYLVYRVLINTISIADFLMFSTTINKLNESLQQCIQLYTGIIKDFMTIDDYRCYMEQEPTTHSPKLPVKGFNHEFSFSDLCYRYPGTNKYALHYINGVIKKGERIAIVGPNGSGKTTFIKLLLRLYNASEGEIRIDNENINKFECKPYFDLFSVVFQDIKVLAFTLAENISLQESQTTNTAKVISSLKQVGLWEKVSEMPKRIHTSLLQIFDDSGIDLSGGEKQKLAAARAFYKDAPVVILDEPTAALDPLSEYQIFKRFDEMVKDKTAFYISHRLSSTRFCDRILVFNEGTIVESGSHLELLNKQGLYAHMFNVQAQYYQESDTVQEGTYAVNQ